MEHAEATSEPPASSPRKWGWLALPGVLLLGAAAAMANFPPIPAQAAQDGGVPLGWHVLLLGAVPWLLQWGGLALLVAAVARGVHRVNSGAVWVGACFPLVVGLAWWAGLLATLWGGDPLDLILDRAAFLLRDELGATSPWQWAVYDILGPLCCPLRLQGPGLLSGWEYVFAALSTLIVMASLVWVLRRTAADATAEAEDRVNWRQLALVTLWTLLYIGPVFLRSALRAATAGS